MFFVIFQSVIQKDTQRHDAAIKFATFCSPVWMYNYGWFIGQNVSSFLALAFHFLLSFSFLLLDI